MTSINPGVFCRSSLCRVQIKQESFLEDINNILNSGDVPNIYALDELDKIYAGMKGVVQDAGLAPTKANFFSAYTKRVRSNIHSVITMRSVSMKGFMCNYNSVLSSLFITWYTFFASVICVNHSSFRGKRE